jgi:hypothetical protein
VCSNGYVSVGVSYVHVWLFQDSRQVDVIASNYPNTGYFDWTVPDRVGSGYKVRIAAVDAAFHTFHDARQHLRKEKKN